MKHIAEHQVSRIDLSSTPPSGEVPTPDAIEAGVAAAETEIAAARFFADLRAKLRAQNAERAARQVLEDAQAHALMTQAHIALVAKETGLLGDAFLDGLFRWVTALHATGQHARASELQASVNLVHRYMEKLHVLADAEARR